MPIQISELPGNCSGLSTTASTDAYSDTLFGDDGRVPWLQTFTELVNGPAALGGSATALTTRSGNAPSANGPNEPTLLPSRSSDTPSLASTTPPR